MVMVMLVLFSWGRCPEVVVQGGCLKLIQCQQIARRWVSLLRVLFLVSKFCVRS